MQVATYATRNFAILGQSELLSPFIGASIQSL
ncbi:Viral cathepsin [Bienertia sinuspersici]